MALDVHGVTGSSPVLSTIKSSEIVRFQSFFFAFHAKKFAVFWKIRFDPNRGVFGGLDGMEWGEPILLRGAALF